MTVQIELGNPQGVLLAEIKERAMKREDVALTYAMAMLSSEVVDWPTVNHAILDRWSMAGLKWIKTRAWRLVEERKAASPEATALETTQAKLQEAEERAARFRDYADSADRDQERTHG